MSIFKFIEKLNLIVPGFIRKNFLRKVIAVFFAILVYMKVSTELGEEKIIQGVPINFITHGNVEVMAYKPKTVNITIRASKKSVNLLTHTEFRVDIPVTEDMLNSQQSTNDAHLNIDIDESFIHTPANVTIISVTPSDITVRCDKNISKKVLVDPQFAGSPPQDYEKGEISISPKHVTLTGPESILKEIKSINTQAIRLDRSTVASFQVEKQLQHIAPKVIVTPERVQVKVEIYKALATRVFENIPLFIMNKGDNLHFTPKLFTKAIDITLHGLKSHLEVLTRSQIRAFIDVTKYDKPGIYQSKVDSWCKDPSLNVKFIEPSYVKVDLSPTPTKEETKKIIQ